MIADRWDRRRTLLICQTGRAPAMASVAAAVWLDACSFPHILPVALLDGLLGAAFEPAGQAAPPQVVPTSQLSRTAAVGPLLGGALVTAGTGGILACAAALATTLSPTLRRSPPPLSRRRASERDRGRHGHSRSHLRASAAELMTSPAISVPRGVRRLGRPSDGRRG
ncbi:hypothetical protein ACFYUV_10190 [Nonomuraea sp. NPDC003560]|uniref:hypothetical protein n=1 Tax=Nonomuraea sp. NPDC003560 TaxID=3364341 RepID=UPI0036A5094C